MLFNELDKTEQAKMIMKVAAARSYEKRTGVVAEYAFSNAEDGDQAYTFAAQLMRAATDYLYSLRQDGDNAVYKCDQCETLYIRQRNDQRFCSSRCRQAHHYTVSKDKKPSEVQKANSQRAALALSTLTN